MYTLNNIKLRVGLEYWKRNLKITVRDIPVAL